MKILRAALKSACLTATCVVGLIAATDASAQNFDRNRNVSVAARPHPEYDPLGVRVGAFTASPVATISAGYLDNFYATETDKTSDVYANLEASIGLRSGWSRHALGFNASAETTQYGKVEGQNTFNYAIGTNGRLDIDRSSSLTANASFARATESRYISANAQEARDPAQYTVATAQLRYSKEFNRVRIRGDVELKKSNFEDTTSFAGALIDQDFRDGTVYEYTGRVDYAFSPATAFFVETSYNERKFNDTARPRDSHGYRALAGVNFELTDLVRAELGLGYLSQKYDNPTRPDISGFSARGELEWFPTQLTTVTLGVARNLEDSSLFGSAGYVHLVGRVRVDHELRRNIILFTEYNRMRDKYAGLSRTDRRSVIVLGASYRMNRLARITAQYRHNTQDSSGAFAGRTFDANQVNISTSLSF